MSAGLVEVYGEKVDTMGQNDVAYINLAGMMWKAGNSRRRSLSTAEVGVTNVDELIRDQRITLHHIAPQMGLRYQSFQNLMVDMLHYIKVCAGWVPHALSEAESVGT